MRLTTTSTEFLNSMSITLNTQYDADIDTLYTLYTNKAYFEKRYANGGITEYHFDRFECSERGCEIKIRFTSPLDVPDGIPASVKKLVPSSQELAYSATWQKKPDGSFHASIAYHVDEHSVKVLGERTLTLKEGLVHCDAKYETTCNLPIVGKLVAKFIEERIERELKGDAELIQSMLHETQKAS